jgi:hypothetical protein
MYAVLAAPGWYNPIQSVEVGEVFRSQVAVSVPPGAMLEGLAVSITETTPVTAANASTIPDP